jgi:hypothetical protein
MVPENWRDALISSKSYDGCGHPEESAFPGGWLPDRVRVTPEVGVSTFEKKKQIVRRCGNTD